MASSPSVAARQTPVQRFEQYDEAAQAVAACGKALYESASRRRSSGLAVTDQDQPDEVFCLYPAHPVRPPLAIVGGMGPLAGADAFRRACARFRNSRVVVLYQACSIPDRSRVILRESGPATSSCRDLASRLAEAVRLAVALAGDDGQPVRCIVVCNTAHYFWRLLQEELGPCDVRMVSLVESSIEALKALSCRRALLLATEGARVGQVFSASCRTAGIIFDEPSPQLSHLLMRAIFEGMKSMNCRRAVELGNEFFETTVAAGRDYDCLLAGCTELPLTIDLLKVHGTPAIRAFLCRVRVVDPVEEALCRV